MLSWIECVCERTNCRFYDTVLETHTEEELDKLQDEYDEYVMDFEGIEFEEDEDYIPSSTNGDYSPSNPWDAPGMSIHDFI